MPEAHSPRACQREHQRQAVHARDRAAHAAGAVSSRRTEPDRHAHRLRHQLLRRVHGPAQWQECEVVHGVCVSGRWRRGAYRRRTGGKMASFIPCSRPSRDCHGFQCGYCTPGFLMSTLQLLDEHPHPTEADIRKGIAGNTCRCTGYQNIFKAIRAAATARPIQQSKLNSSRSGSRS